MRLDKFIRSQGIASRKGIRSLIKKGLVKVNNKVEKDPGTLVSPHNDEIYLEDHLLVYREFVYYMLNKPRGIITATNDKVSETVLDLLPENIKRMNVFPVGRLDKDTEGLLILTNDGIFTHNLLSPKKCVKKLYEAKLDCFPGYGAVKLFEEGIILDDGYKTLPATLEYISVSTEIVARIEIYEGKFHQIKRMFKAVGANVPALKTLRMGEVWLDENLKPGEYRELTRDEIQLLGGKI